MHRFYNLLPSFVNHFYNLSDFMMSTNFTPDNWFDEFYGFTSILGRFQNRKFNFTLQLSIDGPEYINDENRGIGTTKKFLQSFNKLLETLDDKLPKNVNLKVIAEYAKNNFGKYSGIVQQHLFHNVREGNI